jgi:hypothetical protein
VEVGPHLEAEEEVRGRDRLHREHRVQELPHRRQPARPFPTAPFRDKNRRDTGTSQSIWTDSKMETAGFSHGESTRLVIEAPWLVNGGHGASLKRHHLTAPALSHRARNPNQPRNANATCTLNRDAARWRRNHNRHIMISRSTIARNGRENISS